MIKSFKNRETEKLFKRELTRRLPHSLQHLARRKLLIIDASITLNDLKVPPGNKLEKLKGDRKNQFSIRINEQWRICFEWKNGDAFNVEIIDYHK